MDLFLYLIMPYNEPLLPGRFYHIFNHAVGNENLFRTDDNYRYFLARYSNFIPTLAATYAYCLLPNHFHFLIQVRSEEELFAAHQNKYAGHEVKPPFQASEFVMQNFSNLFNSYAKSYNKRFQRKGALFIDYMRRKLVDNDDYLLNLIHYIHYNPVHHGICKKVDSWYFSSYHSVFSHKPTLLMRSKVVELFKSRDEYIKVHSTIPQGLFTDELEF
jgi:REP element-mobilizing transposase RayT